MKVALRPLSTFVLAIACAGPAVAAAPPPPRVAGLIESVVVGRPGIQFEAKLDTGADISSIDATQVKQYRRQGMNYMDFTVVRADGSRVQLSGPLVRHVRIRRGGAAASRRPVVALELCLGSISRTVEVSLANREGLEYDVLIGTNFLKGYFMVDPMRMHVLVPQCRDKAGR